MYFIDNELVEKVKPQIISAVKNLFVEKKQLVKQQKSIFSNNVLKGKSDKINKRDNSNQIQNTTDVFMKKRIEDTIVTPVSKKVWVDGNEYNIMAFSQAELDEKITKIKSKSQNKHNAQLIDTTQFNFIDFNKKEDVNENEWPKMNDVWYQNYNIA